MRFARLTLLLVLPACTTWRVNQRPVDEVVAAHRHDVVAVSLRDQRWVVLSKPRIENDSIVGKRITGDLYEKGQTALPLRSITAVETRRFSLIRTLALVAALSLVPSLWHFATVEDD